jgi:hypothetical protein
LTLLLRDHPDADGTLLQDVVSHAAQRRFKPLRRHVYSFSEASRAFELMLRTKHIGKVVLSFEVAAPEVFRVRAGNRFRRVSPREFIVQPGCQDDYVALLQALESESAAISHIVHLWNVAAGSGGEDLLEMCLERSFFSLTWLA